MTNQLKYYYTCPLAAAWMAKHFEMEFLNANYIPAMKYGSGRGFITEYGDLHQSGFFWSNKSCEVGKIYIRKDSFPLLEPQENDILKNTLGYPVLIKTNGFASLPLAEVPKVFQPSEIFVIQRNGIAFMWPEKE